MTDVPTDAHVRHFDELDEGTQTFVVRFAAGWIDDAADPSRGDAADLVAGDVVVFTDYLALSAT